VVGGGQLALLIGLQTFQSPVNLTRLTLDNGRNQFFAEVDAERIEIEQGEIILHSYAFVKEVRRTHAHARTQMRAKQATAREYTI
jgi:hypothetical protein